MTATDLPPNVVDAFIARWDGTRLAERANDQLFLSELCDLLGVRRPEPVASIGGTVPSHKSHHTSIGHAGFGEPGCL